jgi:hypothetical protein
VFVAASTYKKQAKTLLQATTSMQNQVLQTNYMQQHTCFSQAKTLVVSMSILLCPNLASTKHEARAMVARLTSSFPDVTQAA